MENRLIRYFADTDLRQGHPKLAAIAKANKIDVNMLTHEFLVFTNKARTGLKLYAPGNVIAYLKMPYLDGKRQKINLNVIKDLPNFFNGTSLNYEGALKKKLEKDFMVRGL